ncbi:ABC-F family ATP-binding cassette domain-containing protein [Acetobacterium sp.]|uniref:ABC-F family ATP-binding cassette domain-containing protein n=1 Tax=Acetobacterium sp. TaxID=1872094 RepID=UPI002F3E3A6E
MGLLDVINVSHSFGDKALYQEASFELYKGEHMGIVGRNGTGKTTLLNSLIGEVIPDEGEIRWQKGIKVGYLDQHAKIDKEISVFDYLKTAFFELYDTEAELSKIYENMVDDSSEKALNKAADLQSLLENSGFYEIESSILKVADGLGITALGMDSKIAKLSGGQRAKVILAKLLLEEPNVLLLDEPTNFLDKEHVDWLTDYLRAYEGTFLVISHDFDFLDKITTCICDIEFCTIKKYTGNITKFIELKGLRKESYIREFESQKKEIKKFEDYISKNKARASTANMAKSRQKQLNKIERLAPPESAPKPNFRFNALPISAQRSLSVKDLEIGYDYPLISKLNFKVESGQKIVITGFNGIGKSTLLKTLIHQIPAISGKFKFADNLKTGYFEQDLNWENPLQTPIQIVSDEFHKLSQSQIRRNLAQCGLKAKSMQQSVSTLSGGEQSKVKICNLMLTQCNFIFLDEPTNHLDADAKEVLKKELINWQGGLIMVSHEALFYEDWADEIINIEN